MAISMVSTRADPFKLAESAFAADASLGSYAEETCIDSREKSCRGFSRRNSYDKGTTNRLEGLVQIADSGTAGDLDKVLP